MHRQGLRVSALRLVCANSFSRDCHSAYFYVAPLGMFYRGPMEQEHSHFWTYTIATIGECKLYREYRLHSPRGSNCESPRVSSLRDGDRRLPLHDYCFHRTPMLPSVSHDQSADDRLLPDLSMCASDERYGSLCGHGGSRFGCENSPKHTHTTYHLCMVAERT